MRVTFSADEWRLIAASLLLPLIEVLAAELPRTMKLLGITANKTQLEKVTASVSELQLQPRALPAFQSLIDAGWRIVALTNGSEHSTRQLLERAEAIDYFSSIFSCDAISKTKPHADVYAMPKQDANGDLWLVAAHAWDIQGAARANLKTAFITKSEQEYLSIYPQPDVIADDLVEAANKIINANKL